MLTYHVGNIFQTKQRVVAHGVNCAGAFGAGIANQIGRRYPDAKQAYLDKFHGDGWYLGDIQIVPMLVVGDPFYIVNMATQERYGRNGIFVDYDAIAKCLNGLLDWCKVAKLGAAIPRIGAGLAGGDWKIINNIIQQCYQNRDVELEVWSLDGDEIC